MVKSHSASMYLTPAKMLLINLIVCILGCLLWLFFLDSHAVLWLGALLYGLGMSSSFPTAIHLVEDYVPLTGEVSFVGVIQSRKIGHIFGGWSLFWRDGGANFSLQSV